MTARSERLPGESNPFSPRIIIALIAVGIISFAAVLSLMAWSPDLASRDRPGPTPYSRSATGYAGLLRILEAEGYAASVSRRTERLSSYDGRLMVVTLPLRGRALDPDDLQGPALIVLPKWTITANPARRAFEVDTRLARRESIETALGLTGEEARIARIDNPNTIDTGTATRRPRADRQMQVIRSDVLEEIIGTGGGQLLSRVPDTEIYVLSDPDLLNNFGLARTENTLTALDIFQQLTDAGRRPVVFDATLHGFANSTNLLKLLLSIPFLGATLIALATIALIGWAAAVRFGAPEREAPAFAPGKQALADNSAGLIAMARREGRMAPGYLALSRRALARELGLPRTLSEAELTALLDRMGEQAGQDRSWSDMGSSLAQPAASRDDLRHKARALWRWRREMTHGNE